MTDTKPAPEHNNTDPSACPTPSRSKVSGVLLLMVVLAVATAAIGGFWLGHRSEPPTNTAAPGLADVGFAQDMAVHHEQAIFMALEAIDKAGPPVRSLALSILVSQNKEVGLMRGWLQLWNAPQLTSGPPMSWTHHSGHAHTGMAGTPDTHTTNLRPDADMGMPGMASQAELQTLAGKTGPDFDVWFLQLMTRHHQGGIDMANTAAHSALLPAVQQIAQKMIFTQAEEINQMDALLRIYQAERIPYPN